MIHVRAVSPPDTTDALVAELVSNPSVFNVVVLRGSVVSPPGDAVQFDVRTGAANGAIMLLREHGLDQHASVILEHVGVELTVPDVARSRQESMFRQAPVWAEVHARMEGDDPYPPSWFFLLAIAGVIAAVGILINSQILIVGAIVVGPEYGAISAVALGLTSPRNWARIGRGLAALLIGFTGAFAAAGLFAVVIRALDLQPRAYELGVRPVSWLIDSPNIYSVVDAVLAGLVGVVSVTESRSGTLIGVFISVTTIPAAAHSAVAMVFRSWNEALGSLEQLLLNIFILIVVGAITLTAVRWFWTWRGNGPGHSRASSDPGDAPAESPPEAGIRRSGTEAKELDMDVTRR